jgi:hypothetical protein
VSLERLVSSTGDRDPEVLAEQQRANTTMGDKRDVLTRKPTYAGMWVMTV